MASSARVRKLRLPDRLHWWHVLVLSLLGGLIVGTVVYSIWPGSYLATSSLLLSDQADVVAKLLPQSSTVTAESEQDRLWAILGSREIRGRLVKKHKLGQKLGMDDDWVAEILGHMTSIQPLGGGLSITVTCRGCRNPKSALWGSLRMEDARQLCAQLANGYVAELESYLAETGLQQAGDNRKFVTRAKEELAAELQESEDRLQQLQTQYHLLDPSDKALRIVDRINAAQQALADAAAQADDVTSSLRTARGQLRDVDALHIAKVVELRNPVITQLEQKLAELRIDMATELAHGKTDIHRDVAQIQAGIDSIEQQIQDVQQETRQELSQANNPVYDGLVSKVVELEIGLAGARARQAKHASLLAAARGRLAELPPVAREYATLKRQQQVQSELMASLTQSLALALIEEQRAKTGSKFTILDTAVPPVLRSGPPTLVCGAITFVIIFIVLAFFMIDRRAFGMF